MLEVFKLNFPTELLKISRMKYNVLLPIESLCVKIKEFAQHIHQKIDTENVTFIFLCFLLAGNRDVQAARMQKQKYLLN